MVHSEPKRTGQELTDCLLTHLRNDKTFFNELNNAFIQYYQKEGSLYQKYPYMYENSNEGMRQNKQYDDDKERLKYEFANSAIILSAGRRIVEVCPNAAQAYIKQVLKIERNDLQHLQSELSSKGNERLSTKEVKDIKKRIQHVKTRISLYSKNLQTIKHVPKRESWVFVSFVEELREDLRHVASISV